MTGFVARAGERARRQYERLQEAAERYKPIGVAVEVVRRDLDVAGTLLAGALAFRIFIWLLPCCLLLTALVGFSSATTRTPDELTRDLGMSPLTANLLGQVGAQAEHGRYVTALLGLVLLVWAGLALGRVLDRIYHRVWRLRAQRGPKSVLARLARYNAALLLAILGNLAETVVVAATGRSPALVSLPSLAFYVLIGIVLLSPGWPPAWRTAWPGALLIAVGLEGLHLVAVLYLPGKLARASELYGALGVAASVLVWLALIARLMVFGQVLNAVLADYPPAAGDADREPDVEPGHLG
jgi:uncharacterized BrkB/YihY/UPF0761 family membrane protein